MKKLDRGEGGFTVVELLIGFIVFAVVALSFLGLFISLVNSSIIAKQKAVASTLATNQMEYLKSLPYDSLAIAGGAIYAANPLPASSQKIFNGVKYTVRSSINYVDDAYDGCASYPTPALKQLYCRNQPAPAGSPATDTNPGDYKVVHVSVTGPAGGKLAEVDTQIAARVSETASSTGALFVNVIDGSGNPVSGASVVVANVTVTPNVNAADNTDSNGIAIFYGLPPDTNNFDYKITASKTGSSTLNTVVPSGSLQPTYPNQKILTQQSSYVTLTIKPQGVNSLVLETTDVSGAALPNAQIYLKGGYKTYTATSDTSYYYDNLSPTDIRPQTDAGGLAAVSNLVPGNYIFCGDSGATGCRVAGTTYYLAAAVPYGGTNAFNPVTVPTYLPASPPSTTFAYNGNNYLQKVRLMLTANAAFPRITSLSPAQISLASDPLANFSFTIVGVNLPCSATAASCATTVKVAQSTSTYTASCAGTSTGLQLSCKVNLTGIQTGGTQLSVAAGGNTLALPASPLLGGFIVAP